MGRVLFWSKGEKIATAIIDNIGSVLSSLLPPSWKNPDFVYTYTLLHHNHMFLGRWAFRRSRSCLVSASGFQNLMWTRISWRAFWNTNRWALLPDFLISKIWMGSENLHPVMLYCWTEDQALSCTVEVSRGGPILHAGHWSGTGAWFSANQWDVSRRLGSYGRGVPTPM